MSLRMQMVWAVLAAAKDADDETVIAACRRIIVANRIANRPNAGDMQLVRAFS